MGLVAISLLPDRPEMTPFFNTDERRIAMARMSRGISGDKGLVVNKGARCFLCLIDKTSDTFN